MKSSLLDGGRCMPSAKAQLDIAHAKYLVLFQTQTKLRAATSRKYLRYPLADRLGNVTIAVNGYKGINPRLLI